MSNVESVKRWVVDTLTTTDVKVRFLFSIEKFMIDIKWNLSSSYCDGAKH